MIVIGDFSPFADVSRLLAVGGKGVGKSTFLRYFANRLLKESGGGSSVLYVDLDPGQAEMTIPGKLSKCQPCDLRGSTSSHISLL